MTADQSLPQWLKDALARIEAQHEQIICDTDAKAREHGVPIGTTVVIRKPPVFTANPQEHLDDFMAREYLRQL